MKVGLQDCDDLNATSLNPGIGFKSQSLMQEQRKGSWEVSGSWTDSCYSMKGLQKQGRSLLPTRWGLPSCPLLLPLLPFILLLEAGTVTEPEFTILNRSVREFVILENRTGVTGTCSHAQLSTWGLGIWTQVFLHGGWGFELRSFYMGLGIWTQAFLHGG